MDYNNDPLWNSLALEVHSSIFSTGRSSGGALRFVRRPFRCAGGSWRGPCCLVVENIVENIDIFF